MTLRNCFFPYVLSLMLNTHMKNPIIASSRFVSTATLLALGCLFAPLSSVADTMATSSSNSSVTIATTESATAGKPDAKLKEEKAKKKAEKAKAKADKAAAKAKSDGNRAKVHVKTDAKAAPVAPVVKKETTVLKPQVDAAAKPKVAAAPVAPVVQQKAVAQPAADAEKTATAAKSKADAEKLAADAKAKQEAAAKKTPKSTKPGRKWYKFGFDQTASSDSEEFVR